ncbi:glutaredoxin family protein [uncultured Psychrobacter sp.]|uniref:glutaredoxin family protein n=1 Tax=uncultured Psychrobacter sp. TaxID=259303 RepID=UPI00259761D2|nr:glutaredoxin family protein [uncultured Psychrobacter sp.]
MDYDNNMAEQDIAELRARIVAANPSLDTSENIDNWWLLGTTGCHLCDVAEQLMVRFQSVQPITYENVDIADFNEDLMMEFATTIPVILTPSKRLDYPFSVMDLQQLLAHN